MNSILNKYCILTLLIKLFFANQILSQEITINFNCLDVNNSFIQMQIPASTILNIAKSDTAKTISVNSEYLFSHDSTFAIIPDTKNFLPLFYISSEELDPSLLSPLDIAEKMIGQKEFEKIIIDKVSIKKQFLQNYSLESALLKYRNKKQSVYYMVNILIINNRVVTIVAKDNNENYLLTMELLLSNIKLLY